MKPLAALSLDLDNKWSYLKTHGDAGWDRYPTYLPRVVPRVLEILGERGLAITWFIVGLDATRAENSEALAAIAAAGHEVGNHSFHHEPWLHLYSDARIDEELARAEAAIKAATGVQTDGFRGPGFSLSEGVLRILARRGYRYDASTFPTYLGPLARAYYFMTARLTPAQQRQRARLFGTLAEGHRPLAPYRWKGEYNGLVEVPVTTMPLLKFPIHVSYLLYLARFSRMAARNYFRLALRMCHASRTPPSILLHPLDFLGSDDDADLGFFPAMDRPAAWKVALACEFLDELRRHFDVQPLGRYVAKLGRLPGRTPRFPQR